MTCMATRHLTERKADVFIGRTKECGTDVNSVYLSGLLFVGLGDVGRSVQRQSNDIKNQKHIKDTNDAR